MATFSASDAISYVFVILMMMMMFMCISKARKKSGDFSWFLKTPQKREKRKRGRARFYMCDSLITSSPLNRTLHRHGPFLFLLRYRRYYQQQRLNYYHYYYPDEGEEDERGGEDAKSG